MPEQFFGVHTANSLQLDSVPDTVKGYMCLYETLNTTRHKTSRYNFQTIKGDSVLS